MLEDPEFRLLLSACRASYQNSAKFGSAPIDEERFLRLVGRHRVDGVANAGISALVEGEGYGFQAQLARQASAVISRNMLQLVGYRDLHRALAGVGVDHIFVKGATLGALAYPSAFIKRGLDIDILVDDVIGAANVLSGLGYTCDDQTLSHPARLAEWHRHHKETSWIRADGVMIDLHSRLTDHRALIPTIGLATPRQTVELPGGMALPTLADPELFAHLCVHGASSCWFRLKWIVDLSAWAHARDIDVLYSRSLALGAGRASGQALLLADRLGLLDLSNTLRDTISRDRITQWLAKLAERELLDIREPTEVTLGTLPIRGSQLLMHKGMSTALREGYRQILEVSRA
ncbi:nucleotidyltransferase family protein [Sphingomonas sp. LY29]|uniref:nucleotidyltransferase family protein n=1 Tax=Sphingomonas sp. LY29 TaxID=3095341 RepID=UPI002D7869C8|nr:nucleotidyltransferase family protein [Sphingomonas sp. LY29]WRP26243.1 nucleotidyltransferase family protein [Sphingomonas sp. LY29]